MLAFVLCLFVTTMHMADNICLADNLMCMADNMF